jgi:hypothetical protein
MIKYTVTVDDYGTKRWYLNDKRHREDGPAIEYTNGTKFWYLNGNRHRTDGPAVECAGNKYWYLNDNLHREDGPAIEWAAGSKCWCLGGASYTEAEWRKQTQKNVKAPCVGKVIEIDGVNYKLVEA